MIQEYFYCFKELHARKDKTFKARVDWQNKKVISEELKITPSMQHSKIQQNRDKSKNRLDELLFTISFLTLA